jgi:cyclopropane fatty-acyl-phospholipid synthase-like methyltransferase
MTQQQGGPAASHCLDKQLARWEERFSIGDYLFGEGPNAYLASKAALLAKDSRALSIADGEGRNSVWLAEQGLQVDAFDFSPTGVKKAQRLARNRGVHVNFSVSEMFQWNWTPSTYDLVAAIFIQFLTPAERDRLLSLIKRTLTPGGLFILQGYSLEQLKYGTGGPSEPDQLYTEPMIREALKDMDVLEILSYEEQLTEGAAHAGMSALMGVLARKR